MRVYVNGEERQLSVFDRLTGAEYAKMVVCAQDQLDTDEYGSFVMTEEEYQYWQKLLEKLQESEDLRLELKDALDYDELNNYILDETMYVTETREIIDMENQSLHEVRQALADHDTEWLKDNGFIKTLEK
ncbi:hypothetical protein [uncultured Megasphaera sp.]|uniref:hypothetical protein n=1 Tax=uncultured Megasphaera sp. TaxID=165188 RepID=UPI002657E3C7|nr:hypothetical protein [uncultured Megasphaera sp.]